MELLLHGTLGLALVLGVAASIVAALVGSLRPAPCFPLWVARWLALTTVIVLWDASFVLLRPWSMEVPLWAPYKDYVQVDKLYGDLDDSFVWSQSVLNLVEVALNVTALSLLHAGSSAAPVVALVVSAMTCSKTVLYHVIEVGNRFRYSQHNDAQTFVMLCAPAQTRSACACCPAALLPQVPFLLAAANPSSDRATRPLCAQLSRAKRHLDRRAAPSMHLNRPRAGRRATKAAGCATGRGTGSRCR